MPHQPVYGTHPRDFGKIWYTRRACKCKQKYQFLDSLNEWYRNYQFQNVKKMRIWLTEQSSGMYILKPANPLKSEF